MEFIPIPKDEKQEEEELKFQQYITHLEERMLVGLGIPGIVLKTMESRPVNTKLTEKIRTDIV
jgi:hypothetical protein